MLRCRRGSIAIIFALSAFALCGLIALGTEVGSWYAIKRNAQNAADAAAIAGALAIARNNVTAGSDNVVTSGVSFANQNGYCSGGSTSCTISGSPVTVSVAQGSYAGGTFTAGAGSAVQAIVTQTQTGLFAGLVGVTSIPIAAGAVAEVQQPSFPCVLALSTTGSPDIQFQGSVTLSAPTCGVAANSTKASAISETGNAATVNAPLSSAGGCSGSICANATTYAIPVANPLSGLDAYFSAPALTGLPNCAGGAPVDYATTHCKNNNTTLSGTVSLSGTYIFSGSLKISNNADVSGTVTIIMLPGSTLSIGNGHTTLNLVAQNPVPSAELPASIPAGTLDGLLWYDPESGGVSMGGGNASATLTGALYFPNADLTWQGTPSVGSTCVEVIASTIAFNGDASFVNSGCASDLKPQNQVAVLVQ